MPICAMCGQDYPEDDMVGDFCINCASIISDEESFI